MDWNVLIDALIGIITPLIWAISLRIARPTIVEIVGKLKENSHNGKNDSKKDKEQ